MSEQDNVAILKRAYEFWGENKEKAFENWMDLMSDDVKLESVADGCKGLEFSKSCTCKEDVLRYFHELASNWEMIDYKVNEFIAQGNRVVAVGKCHWRYRMTEKQVETPKIDIITMKDSKIVDFYEIYDTAKAL